MSTESSTIPATAETLGLVATLDRLRALDSAVIEAMQTIRFALDDLGAVLEGQRQLRHEIVARLTNEGSR